MLRSDSIYLGMQFAMRMQLQAQAHRAWHIRLIRCLTGTSRQWICRIRTCIDEYRCWSTARLTP